MVYQRVAYTVANSVNQGISTARRTHACYGPYKRDSTDGQKGLRLTQDQYARGGTDRTSGTMGRGVAKSHDRT